MGKEAKPVSDGAGPEICEESRSPKADTIPACHPDPSLWVTCCLGAGLHLPPSAPPTVPAEKRESETSLKVGFCPFSEGHLSVEVLGRFSDGLII